MKKVYDLKDTNTIYDIAALGELLIDFTPYGVSDNGNNVFERNPGGAPANVLTAAAKLGKSTAFIGMAGKDQFGVFLKNILEEYGVSTKGLKLSEEANTTLAFVHLDKSGDRKFSFYRNPGADVMLREEDIDFDIIKNSSIFHFGSLSLTQEPVRSATLAALRYAKDHRIMVSYDPNLRPALWKSLEEAKGQIISCLRFANILKVSEEELEFITGTKSLEEGTDRLHAEGPVLIFVTLGAEGSFFSCGDIKGKVSGFRVNAVDTTGAGDGFFGAVLQAISCKSLEEINDFTREELANITSFANAVGALVTTKKGAIPAMPGIIEINKFMSSSNKNNAAIHDK